MPISFSSRGHGCRARVALSAGTAFLAESVHPRLKYRLNASRLSLRTLLQTYGAVPASALCLDTRDTDAAYCLYFLCQCLRSWPRCVVETVSSTLCGMAVSSTWIYFTNPSASLFEHRDERAIRMTLEAACEARFVRSISWRIRHWHGLLVPAESWWHLRFCCASGLKA